MASTRKTPVRRRRSSTQRGARSSARPRERSGRDKAIARLEIEIPAMQRYLLTLIAQQEAANQHLNAANEAVVQANRQLQRMNEDLRHLLSGVDLPVLLVGADLSVRRFTERAAALLDLGRDDICRPLPETAAGNALPELAELVHESIARAEASERAFRDRQGRAHRVRVNPCKDKKGTVEGAILLFVAPDEPTPDNGG
jgi:two-component system CheB/CheR fusion protein